MVRSRTRRLSQPWKMLLFIGWTLHLLCWHPAFAAQETGAQADELIPGVSLERLRSAGGIVEDPPTVYATEEAARVLWALARLPDAFWSSLDNESSSKEAEVTQFTGQVTEVVAIRIPADLADLLEQSRLYRLTVIPQVSPLDAPSGEKDFDAELREPESDGTRDQELSVTVIASQVPEIWARAGDSLNEKVQVTGVQLNVDDSKVVFGRRIRWLMDSGLEDGSQWPIGWQLLGKTGFDCGLLESVAKRSRGPLVAEDTEAFYGMLAAAHQLAKQNPNTAPSETAPLPTQIDTADLLRKNRQLVGHWLRLNLETARLSRVIVTDAEVRRRLGSDTYWQIDGFGNLDRVRIELEAGQGGAENLIFENRFPVSLAIVDLPEWLNQKIKQTAGVGRVDVSMLTEPVTVEAFFYRLWSYESEFATSRGGRQVAPLLIATHLESRAGELAASAGQVKSIGWLLAIAVIGSILLTSIVLWRVGKRDAAVSAQRRDARRNKGG